MINILLSYENYECAIQVKNMNYDYLGVWKCQVIIYRFLATKLLYDYVRQSDSYRGNGIFCGVITFCMKINIII